MSTMTPSETLTFWQGYIQRNPDASPLLARALPQWTTLFPVDAPELTSGQINLSGQSSAVAWEDFEPANPWDEIEAAQLVAELERRIGQVLNQVAFNRLWELTTEDDGQRATEMDLAALVDRIVATTDPLQQMAVFDGPVSAQTQIAWLVAWWIQDARPVGMPLPAWVTAPSSTSWPTPAWEASEAPHPTWLRQWLRTWAAQHAQPAVPAMT